MERLNAILSVIPACEVMADIGCDHGKLTRRALLEGRAKRVIATDISEKCLNKARELNSDLKNVKFSIGDGLEALDGESCDVIVISGMGGNTIMNILEPLPDATLILQPQSDAPALRRFLVENNYFIKEDFVTCANSKFYDIIRAEKGSMTLNKTQLLFGAYYEKPNRYLKQRLELIISKTLSYKPTPKNLELIQNAREAIKWQP